MLGTGGATVTVAVPGTPSIVPLIVALPAARAVTTPVAEMGATLVSEVDQVAVRPPIVPPVASYAVALNCEVCPGVIESELGVSVTLATEPGVTVIAAVSALSLLVAMMSVEPSDWPVTMPDSTVATLESALSHATVP